MRRKLVPTLALAAFAAACSAPSPHAVGDPVLPFLEDDWAQALSEARARHVPIFVEAWAPW